MRQGNEGDRIAGRGPVRRAGIAAAAAALAVGGIGLCTALPAHAAGTAGLGLDAAPSAGSNGCVIGATDIATPSDPFQQPWEDTYADPDLLHSKATGAGVTIAVIDSGLAGGNAQVDQHVLGGKSVGPFAGSPYEQDTDGHGTMVASIIDAQPSSGNAMVGLAPGAGLLIYRENGCNEPGGGDSHEQSLADAIDDAVAAGADIINISQDSPTPDPGLYDSLRNAEQHNVLVVASVGNDGQSDVSAASQDYGVDPAMYPAAYAKQLPNVLAVGAVDASGAPYAQTETGQYVSLTAPGVNVQALLPDGTLVTDAGTSFAAPFVAGLAALVLQLHPGLPPLTLIRLLESTATGHGAWNDMTGWGEVQPEQALDADPAHLGGLWSAVGPDALSSGQPSYRAEPGMNPVVAPVTGATVQDQDHLAYAAVGGAAAVVVLGGMGLLVAGDARRRRRGAEGRRY